MRTRGAAGCSLQHTAKWQDAQITQPSTGRFSAGTRTCTSPRLNSKLDCSLMAASWRSACAAPAEPGPRLPAASAAASSPVPQLQSRPGRSSPLSDDDSDVACRYASFARSMAASTSRHCSSPPPPSECAVANCTYASALLLHVCMARHPSRVGTPVTPSKQGAAPPRCAPQCRPRALARCRSIAERPAGGQAAPRRAAGRRVLRGSLPCSPPRPPASTRRLRRGEWPCRPALRRSE